MYVEDNLIIKFSRLLESVCLCPKVIPLSGFDSNITYRFDYVFPLCHKHILKRKMTHTGDKIEIKITLKKQKEI
jgi:hypothetical protein